MEPKVKSTKPVATAELMELGSWPGGPGPNEPQGGTEIHWDSMDSKNLKTRGGLELNPNFNSKVDLYLCFGLFTWTNERKFDLIHSFYETLYKRLQECVK